jgi:hypothetical protein
MLPVVSGMASGGSAPSSTSLGTVTWTPASLQVTYDVTMP